MDANTYILVINTPSHRNFKKYLDQPKEAMWLLTDIQLKCYKHNFKTSPSILKIQVPSTVFIQQFKGS